MTNTKDKNIDVNSIKKGRLDVVKSDKIIKK